MWKREAKDKVTVMKCEKVSNLLLEALKKEEASS